MNKRIKELAEQADKIWDGASPEDSEWCEKFAQLILAEVQKVYDDNRLDDDYEIHTFLNVVKEHFGVEK
mgnify:CR=1 FL=1